jgi:hypothetical protein
MSVAIRSCGPRAQLELRLSPLFVQCHMLALPLRQTIIPESDEREMKFPAIALAMILPISSSAALAGARDDVLQALGRCSRIADNQARLACYDGLSPRLKDALATPPPSLDRTPTKEEQESWFGFDLGNLFGGGGEATTPEQFGKERTPEAQAAREAEEREVESISAGVREVSFTLSGHFIVFLDNGQVWRQLQGDSDRAHFKSDPKENRVTISRGALGSYNLSINGSGKIFKVTRVK